MDAREAARAAPRVTEMQASDEMVDHSLLRASFAGDLEHMTARLELVGADGGAELGVALVRPVHAAATR